MQIFEKAVPPMLRKDRALRVLVVEDDALIGMLLLETLEAMGHVVCGIATTETEAVAAALRDVPDLIFLDRRLAEGTGDAAILAIHRVRPIPYIVTSGNPDMLAPAGVIALRKPFQEHEIARAIERAAGMVPARP